MKWERERGKYCIGPRVSLSSPAHAFSVTWVLTFNTEALINSLPLSPPTPPQQQQQQRWWRSHAALHTLRMCVMHLGQRDGCWILNLLAECRFYPINGNASLAVLPKLNLSRNVLPRKFCYSSALGYSIYSVWCCSQDLAILADKSQWVQSLGWKIPGGHDWGQQLPQTSSSSNISEIIYELLRVKSLCLFVPALGLTLRPSSAGRDCGDGKLIAAVLIDYSSHINY